MRRLVLPIALAFAFAFGGCNSEKAVTSWTEIDLESADSDLRTRTERAGTAAQKLGRNLVAQLQTALAEMGPEGALEFCHQNAQSLTQQFNESLPADSRAQKVGRTSFRLRNPENAPPEWAREAVARKENRPHAFRGPDDRLGVLLPIQTGAQCVLCHGDEQNLPSTLTAKLEEHYPEDQATGFQPGDLRGYFWVEAN